MRWQKQLRFAIALFVVIFAAVVVVSLRKGQTSAAPPAAGVTSASCDFTVTWRPFLSGRTTVTPPPNFERPSS